MDSKVFRMAILAIISAFLLVLVIVYATNADKINALLGKKSSTETEVAAEADAEEETEYGDRIGDNLNAFLFDEDFFDEAEKIPSVVVIRKSSSSVSTSDTGDLDAEASEDAEDSTDGTGMAVVGELQNPNAARSVDDEGFLTTVPEEPPGGFGEFIPGTDTSGTVVGTMP